MCGSRSRLAVGPQESKSSVVGHHHLFETREKGFEVYTSLKQIKLINTPVFNSKVSHN